MNIMVIGSGGREHALVWKLAKSPKVGRIFCAPGNAGIAGLAQCVAIPDQDVKGLLEFALQNQIDLTVVGPEGPLALGIVDLFEGRGLKIFGPSGQAARLEASKIFAKEFCSRHQIPTAPFQVFENEERAKQYLKNQDYPVVVKADGLAKGKGVFVSQNEKEAYKAIDRILRKKEFGNAGKFLIEEYLKGEEVSFMALADGKTLLPLSSAKDHKRLLEGDKGPNTGGMGAYSPAPLITASLYEKIMEQIMIPAVEGMGQEGNPFRGILYAGLMVCDGNPNLLEFNVRLGDPEAQVVLPRLKTDLLLLFEAALEGRLHEAKLSWDTRHAACVVMVSEGYPEKYKTGFPLQGLVEDSPSDGEIVFHAGTKMENGKTVTAGGRVINVTGLGRDLNEAIGKAYEGVGKISWRGSFYRRDIGGGAG